MRCDEVRGLVNAWLDAELGAAQQLAIEAHLGTCPACAGTYRAARALQAAVRAPEVRFHAPVGLEGRVRRAVGDHADATAVPAPGAWQRRRLPGLRAPSWVGLAAAAVLVFFAGYLVGLRPGRPVNVLETEVLAAHVRSLMPEHLTDVVSSDQHAVKPWFAGRIDFSPFVPNLDGQGFLLAGGRLDYVGSRTVASVVYRRRQHVLNVFMWPASTRLPETATTDRGFNVRHWSDGGMECWVVSDLNSKELDEFVTLFRRSSQ